jgi:hypothetical protein
MNAEGLEQRLKKMFKQAGEGAEQLDVPCAEHMSFIPSELRSNVILMKSQPLKQEDMPTVFLGTLRPNFPDDMWKDDVENWKSYLHIGTGKSFEVSLKPLSQATDRLDSRDAITKIETALEHINTLASGEKLRVIVLGTGYSAFLYDALTYLLREWKEPDGKLRTNKYMQLFTSGDTGKRDINNFCQWLCISGACECIEYINTMKYHPFGYCSSGYSKSS